MAYDPDNPPQWRKAKVDDIASGAAQMLVALVRESRDAIPSCLNCGYSEIHTDTLGQRMACNKFKQYPPPHVIVNACPGYADKDAIPF
jgi:hypothetical protein